MTLLFLLKGDYSGFNKIGINDKNLQQLIFYFNLSSNGMPFKFEQILF